LQIHIQLTDFIQSNMKKFYILTLAALILSSGYVFSQRETQHQKDAERAKLVNTRVDNNGYWKKMAALGLAKLNSVTPVKPAVYVGSEIRAFSVITDDSPDVPVATSSSTQSENSIFIHPGDNQVVLNSNNSTPNPASDIYGANSIESFDAGLSWDGSVEGAGGSNWGDPVAIIGLDGAYYIGAITTSFGQLVAKSTNQGGTYTSYTVSSGGGQLDKNHLWIDNSTISPYSNNLYDAWTDFGGSANNNIGFSRSTNGGVNWSSQLNVSSAVNAGSHCQGVNINSGPNGEVYVIWAIYDGWPTDESAIGMARSFDGGATFEPATRVIQNIRGIRTSDINKNMRKNSFPSMAVDISGGENSGNIYIVWTNIGVPGINTGDDVDVYIARSEDLGVTWSTPARINQDPAGLGKKHFFPWITCDPENGILSVVFYDDRNVGSSQCEVYCANSSDGGETWEDFKVSDVAFTPAPIPGLADMYMGDYLGISARGGWVYPAWGDNRTGSVMTYVSPYQTNPLSKPSGLTANVTFETGISDLHWSFIEAPGFSYFKIYRGVDSVGMAYDTVYNDQLPTYGIYLYKVTAKYLDGSESSSSNASVQWGNAQISVTPLEIEETLMPGNSVTRMVTISNIGQLEMNYNISMYIPSGPLDDSKAYCYATGGCDEFINRVQLNEIDNITECTGYGDYTNLSTLMSVGESYEIIITNGNPTWPADMCGVWVDWNQDEVFDANESVPVNGNPGVGPYTAQIAPPVGALPGETRLRARIVYNQTPEPCDETSYGEVEDYTVSVLSWLVADPLTGTVPAGENMEIAVTLSAVDMALGTYTAELNVFSNDPDDPEITVPITMHVAETAVTISADDESICIGEDVQITSVITGGSGTFTYTWTSDPVGFTSSDPDITDTPEVTTTYFLEVFDGSLTLNDQITIQVNPLPSVNIGADISVCEGASYMIDAGAGFATYLWSTGETGQTINVTEPGIYWVEVANQANCTDRDSLIFSINPLPVVNLGADQSFCEGNSVMLSANPGFTSYFWNTGATSYYISVDSPGDYWVVVIDENGCTNNDTINLTMNPKPQVSLGADQTFCEGTSVTLDAGNSFTSYLWSTGATGSSINSGQPGDYWVEVTDANGCSNRDTVVLTMNLKPVVSLGADHSFCEGNSVTLDAGAGLASYLWSTGETTSSVTTSLQGEYWVFVTNINQCSNSDTIVLTMVTLPLTPEITSGPSSVDNFLNPTSDFTSSASTYATSYEWLLEPVEAGSISGTGTTAQVTWSSGFAGTAQVSVKGLNDCGTGSFSPSLAVSVYSSQGISENAAEHQIMIYPNPTDGKITIRLSSQKTFNGDLTVTDAGGSAVFSQSGIMIPAGDATTLDLGQLPKGIYSVKLSSKSEVYYGRVIMK